MKFFKNTELAKLYHVSEKSVRNWISAAQAGKLNLTLYEERSRHYIANTTANITLVKQLVDKGKKYKNSRGLKVVTPSEEFYKTYNRQQIRDIVSSISIHKEVPNQYGYFNGGTISWDEYSSRLAREENPNMLNQTTELLELNTDYIDRLLEGYEKVNVIDLGPGNGLPIRPTLARLLEQGRLNRYIAIDISSDMLAILKKNATDWFGDRVNLETYVCNFAEDQFKGFLAEDKIGGAGQPGVVNVLFLLGGTLNNFRLPDHILRTINNSMGADDLLIYSGYLDTPHTRRHFDLSGINDKNTNPGVSYLVAHLLRIWPFCDLNLFFSEGERARYRTLTPRFDLAVMIDVGGRTHRLELNKNDSILLWRHRHYSLGGLVDLFDKNDFDLMQAAKSKDQNYALLITRIKIGHEQVS